MTYPKQRNKEVPIRKNISVVTLHSLCTPAGRKSIKTLQFPAQSKSHKK